MRDFIKSKVIIQRTSKSNSTQAYTYDNTGIAYDSGIVQYGGVYGGDIYRIKMRGMNYITTTPSPPTPPTSDSGYLIGVLGLSYP
jgi:hypothetical protein